MEIIIHRVNTTEGLLKLAPSFGAEIDIRAKGSKLVMNHEPFEDGEDFSSWITHYHHGTLVLNIKEAGIETEVLRLVRQQEIRSYFLLDVEFPYIYRASNNGETNIAMRYSEEESIETVKRFNGKVDWVWIDTFTRLPLDTETVNQLRDFKTCLVCPERWGRPQDIKLYRQQMRDLNFEPDAVMTAYSFVDNWQ